MIIGKKNDKECRHQVDVRVVPDMLSLLSTHTCRHAFACSMPDDGRAAMQTTSTESHPIVTDWLNRTEPLWWLAENMPSDLACCWEVAGSSNEAQRARSEVADRSTGGDSYKLRQTKKKTAAATGQGSYNIGWIGHQHIFICIVAELD